MNLSLITHELLVLALALGLLLADLFLPVQARQKLGYAAAIGLGIILCFSLLQSNFGAGSTQFAFGKMYVMDPLALFFKRLFLLAGIVVVLMSIEFADRFGAGVAEFYALLLFALSGMLFASSANDFALLLVSLQFITVSLYVFIRFQCARLRSLDAGW